MSSLRSAMLIVLIIVLWVIVVTIRNILRHYFSLPREADIVIIGSGPGGCVMARRLHERYPHLSVILLERGKDYRNDRKVYRSEAALEIAYSPPYSEVLPNDFPKSVCSFASMVGGGSQHNFGLVVKGSELFHQTKWIPGFESSEAEFATLRKRVEERMDITPLPVSINLLARALPSLGALLSRGAEEIRQGLDVISNIGPLRANEELSKWIAEALKRDTQAEIVEDYNLGGGRRRIDLSCPPESGTGKANVVCYTPQLFVDSVLGIRAGVARAYLPINDEHNYRKVEEADVDYINKQAGTFCVVVLKDGRSIRAKRKVILSAGAIHTPLILQKSELGGPQVGKNLINHYGCSMVLAIRSKHPDFSSGPLAFLSSDQRTRKWEIVTSGSTLTNLNFLVDQGIDVQTYLRKGYKFITFLGWILHPKARGSVLLSDNSHNPDIRLRMFENAKDRENVIELMRYFGNVLQYLILQCGKSNIEKAEVLFPSQSVFSKNDPDELLKTAKIGISLTDHYVGTCAYGKVLNKDFSLKTERNIHVVDASAIPIIPDGNTEYATLLMAELAASRIIL